MAINVDYLNEKLGPGSSLFIKEGSVGSLSVEMPWKGKGCQVEVDEFELVLAPCVASCSSDGDKLCSSGPDNKHEISNEQRKLDGEKTEKSFAPSPGDVHEGDKTIAKMVKWLITSFNVTIKKIIIAFDPNIGESSGKFVDQRAMAFRVSEIACGTFVSEDVCLPGDVGISNFLGISRLTNYVTFQEAVLELLDINFIDRQTAHASASGTSTDEASLELQPDSASHML